MKKPWRNNWKKPKFYELELIFPVFSDFRVSVIITDDLVRTPRYVSDRDYIRDHEGKVGCDAFTAYFPGNGRAIIYIPPNATMGTVAHETYHSVRMLLEQYGAKEEEEVTAYHLGYIVDKVTEFNLKVAGRFKKTKKGKKS